MSPFNATVEIAERLADELRANGTRARAEKERQYLKSDLDHLGVPVPMIRRITTSVHRDVRPLTHDHLVALVDDLWSRDVHECRMAAVELLKLQADVLDTADLAWIEGLLRTSRTWALVDVLAATIVGGVIEADPTAVVVLDRWLDDDDFWIRRSAMLALLHGVGRGAPDLDRIDRYGEALLDEKEFFIRKAIGWVLRELSKNDPDWVAAWLEPRMQRASGVTIREAVKYLSEDERDRLLALR